MLNYQILLPLSYCAGCWVASILAIIDGREKYKKRFGNRMIPTVVVTGILSPVLLVISVLLGIGRFIFNGLN